METVRHTESRPELLPIAKAARILGVSVDTLRRWEREGRIESERTLGGHRRFSLEAIEATRSAA